MQKGYLFFPAILNAVLCFISVPTGIVFYISKDNHFGRGPLGYLTYFIDGLYLVYLIICVFRNTKKQKEDYFLLLFMSVIAVLCLVMPLFMSETSSHWFNITIAIEILFYYIYLLQQFTKRDPLTKLLNRQSYYSDAEKYINSITAVIAMDMDGLKEINDKEGHIAGDTALKTLADCFWNAAKHEERIYRIGGDEYVILCLGKNEDEVRSLIECMRKEIVKTPYSCSIGYAMKNDGASIDELYHKADAKLYEEKKQYYERVKKTRRKH